MSESDSFIDEVSEEVRRDRLYHYLRRYGWIAVALVLLLVGGAAFVEWRQASERAEARAFGDAIIAALDQETGEARRAALAEIDAEGARAALIAMLAAEAQATADERAASAERLQSVLSNAGLPRVYRDLATLKLVMLRQGEMPADEARAMLAPLVTPGAPYRLLALEQMALLDVAAGETEPAIETLRKIAADGQATQGLRQRARRLIVALGGTLDTA